MRIAKKWYVIGLAFCLIAGILLVAQFFYFALNPLGPDDLRNRAEIISPSKNIIVDSCNFYGNATSTDGTLVIIRRRSERFDLRKNFCLLSDEGLRKTKVTWVSDSKLEIQYQPDTVYRKATEWNGIQVSYSEIK
jgi:hypothetical protein